MAKKTKAAKAVKSKKSPGDPSLVAGLMVPPSAGLSVVNKPPKPLLWDDMPPRPRPKPPKGKPPRELPGVDGPPDTSYNSSLRPPTTFLQGLFPKRCRGKNCPPTTGDGRDGRYGN